MSECARTDPVRGRPERRQPNGQWPDRAANHGRHPVANGAWLRGKSRRCGDTGRKRSTRFAVVYALVLGLFVYREFPLSALPRIVVDTVETTGVVMALVMTAALLGYCISVSRLPQEFGAALTGLTSNPLVYLLIVNVLLLIVGCFMEALSAMLVLIPILVPTAIALGVDPVQFGLVFVLNLMIGTITPPVGVVLYVTAKVADVPFERVSRAVVPYLLPLVAVLAAITLWPPLTTWLPGLLLAK